MNWFGVILLAALSAAQKPIETCTKETLKCPITRDQWDKRYREFPCFEEGTNYTCLQAIGGILVEACSYPDIIEGSIGKCPVFYICDGTIPVLGLDANFNDCPDDLKGCPGKYHPKYTVNEMYKYPACITTSWTELSTSTIPMIPETEDDSKDEHMAVYIILPMLLCLLIISICGVALWFVRKQKARNQLLRNTSEESQLLSNLPAGEQSMDTTEEQKQLHTLSETVSLNDKLMEELCEKYDDEIQMIRASPLQYTSKISMDELYSPVSVREDMEYNSGRKMGRGNVSGKHTKPVEGPHDLFLINGKNAKNIFMIGDAGFGKSVFCLRMIKYWLGQNSENSQEEKEWVHFLQEFSFLFLVRLRRMDSSQTALGDMICNDLFTNNLEFHDVIRDVLRNKDCRCLVLIDGLDEAKFETGFLPKTIGMTNCTFFWTMRPWKLDEFSYLIRKKKDRVVEIHGLTDKGVQIITENILVHHLGLLKESSEYQYIQEKSEDPKHKSILKIPLMAMACIELWYDKRDIGESFTSLYMALLDLLIKRALKGQRMNQEMVDYFEKVSQNQNVPSIPILFTYDSRKTFIPVLLDLGRIAYNDVSSGKPNLVFMKSDLERKLGQAEFLFGLETGLLSKCEAAGCGNIENVSVNFFHKSIQEFLAALYIETNAEVKETFFNDLLGDVKRILEHENVLIFLSGINPTNLGRVSRHIVGIAKNDTDMNIYREFRDLFHRSERVESLYRMQSRCLRESKDKSHEQQECLEFHVSDINIHFYRNEELIEDTKNIMVNHHADVKSLWIEYVPNEIKNGIPDGIVEQFLSNVKLLQSLCINGTRTHRTLTRVTEIFSSLTALVLINVVLTTDSIKELRNALQNNRVLKTFGYTTSNLAVKPPSVSELIDIFPTFDNLSTLYIGIENTDDKDSLLSVLGHIPNLQTIYFYGIEPYNDSFNKTAAEKLCQMNSLKVLGLGPIHLDCDDSHVALSPDMTQLEQVLLYQVEMTDACWEKFLSSISEMHRKIKVCVITKKENDNGFKIIRSSNTFTVDYDEGKQDEYGYFEISCVTTSFSDDESRPNLDNQGILLYKRQKMQRQA